MTDVERLITLRKAIINEDITVDRDGPHCVHNDCDVCTASLYCESFPAKNHHAWLVESNAFLKRVKYRIPSLSTLSEQYPEYFI